MNRVIAEGEIPEAAGRSLQLPLPLPLPLLRKDYVDTRLSNAKKLYAANCLKQSKEDPEKADTRALFITSTGNTLSATDITRAISSARSAQTKRAGGGLSNEQLAPRDALAVILERDAGYNHRSMVKLTFDALDKKIDSLDKSKQTAVRRASEAWYAVWETAPLGEGKKAWYVFLTRSGGKMRPSNLATAISRIKDISDTQ